MVKTLTKIGSSLGLVIEKPILELLGIDKDTVLQLRTDGDALIIRPLRQVPEAEAVTIAKQMMTIHAETFRKLAK